MFFFRKIVLIISWHVFNVNSCKPMTNILLLRIFFFIYLPRVFHGHMANIVFEISYSNYVVAFCCMFVWPVLVILVVSRCSLSASHVRFSIPHTTARTLFYSEKTWYHSSRATTLFLCTVDHVCAIAQRHQVRSVELRVLISHIITLITLGIWLTSLYSCQWHTFPLYTL